VSKRFVAAVALICVFGFCFEHALAEDAGQAAKTALRLPKVIGSGMVLQREMEVPIWGWAAPLQKVTVRLVPSEPGSPQAVKLTGSEQTATADANGKWMVKLPAMKAGGPHKMTITAAGKAETIELTDILVGEVWVCSGQSNMEWAVSNSYHSKTEIPAANYPQIRLFHVPKVAQAQPADDVNASWKACTPQTVPGFSAVGYFFGREIHKELKVPVGLINASWGGSAIQPWTPAEGYALVPAFVEGKIKNTGEPGMYNGMIHPLIPFAVRGALWYQGESNMGGAPTYCERMKALILGWRKVWGQGEFPFYFVQLAPFAGHRGDLLPIMWEQQTETLGVPNTGMAVITDLVDNVHDIHPKNKVDVGKRLALWAMAKTYGRKDLVYSGPLYKSMSVRGNKIIISFDHVGGGLVSRDGKPLTWFTIAGKDRTFVEAKAEIVGNTVEVSSDKVGEPAAVRFGWGNIPLPNLMNKEGLPASPFRTDRW